MTTPTVTAAETFLQRHERLIIVLLVVLCIYFVAARIAKSHEREAQVAVAVTTEKAQIAAAQSLAAQRTTEEALASAKADIATMQRQVATATAALAQQDKVDAAMTTALLAQRIPIIAGVPQSAVTSTPTTVTLSSTAAHTITTELEQLPVVKLQLSDTQKIVAADQTVIAAQAAQIATQTSEIAANHAACTAQVAVLNDKLHVSTLHKLRDIALAFGIGLLIHTL